MRGERTEADRAPYHFVALDSEGRERLGPDGEPASSHAAASLAGGDFTDVFLFSHGWLNDVEVARRSYGRWLESMTRSRPSERLARVRSGFRPLLVGVHWPSKPWGNERLDGPGAQGPVPADPDPTDGLAWLAETPDSEAALQAILKIAQRPVPVDLRDPPFELLDACHRLADEVLGPPAGPAEAPPDVDREPIDPALILRGAASTLHGASFGGRLSGDTARNVVLAFPRLLSFWKMKARGLKVGKAGAADVLRMLCDRAGPDVRFHLAGHSFGTIVVSAMVQGTAPGRPIHSLALIQGALSLWSYADEIPGRSGQSGRFLSIVRDGLVAGPIITTNSQFDYAVNWPYTLGARLGRQVDFAGARYPLYGAIGRHGLRGRNVKARDASMMQDGQAGGLEHGRVHNLNATQFISERVRGDPFIGAHNNISHPAVAATVWAAALSTPAP